jgi:hypothetical protein
LEATTPEVYTMLLFKRPDGKKVLIVETMVALYKVSISSLMEKKSPLR